MPAYSSGLIWQDIGQITHDHGVYKTSLLHFILKKICSVRTDENPWKQIAALREAIRASRSRYARLHGS